MRKKRLNGEGTISKVKRGDKDYYRYMVTTGYDDLGRQLRKQFYGKTQEEAINKYAEWKKTQAVNSSDLFTFAGAYKDWLFTYKKLEYKKSTFERYYGIYENYISNEINTKKLISNVHSSKLTDPNISSKEKERINNAIEKNKKLAKLHKSNLGNKKLTDIDTKTLQLYFNKLHLSFNKPASTLKSINMRFSSFFKDMVVQGKTVNNPCIGIKYPKDNYTINESEQFILLSKEEQDKLIAASKGDNLELVINLGLRAGMRLGEILALTPKDFDLKNGWININKTLKKVADINNNGERNYSTDIMTPKTKNSIRKVPLAKILIPLIEKQIDINARNKSHLGELYCDHHLLICKEDGNPIDTKLPNRRLKSLLKKAGIDKDLHFHNLRHLFISNCFNKNIDVKTVSGWVGHSDISVTLNIYTKISEEKMQASSDLINSIFDDAL